MSRLLDPMHRRHLGELGDRSRREGPGGRLRKRLDRRLAGGAGRARGKRRRPRPRPVADRHQRPRPRVPTGRHPRRAGRSRRLRPGDRAGGPPSRRRSRAGDRQPRRQPRPRRGDPADRAGLPPGQRRRAAADKEFWDGWLAWAGDQGIDYHVGRSLAPRLAALGLEGIEGTAETAVYNGGSPWAEYWRETVAELRGPLVGSGHLDDGLVDTFLAHCADPAWWTETISFTAVRARKG